MNTPEPRHPANGVQGTMHSPTDAAAESNHRIANSLTIAAAFLRLQRRQAQSDDVRQSLLSAEARLSSIAKVHAYLQKQGAAVPIRLDDYLLALLPEIGHAVGMDCRLTVSASVGRSVSDDFATQLAVILNELVLNAFKHGYRGMPGGSAMLRVDSAADGALLLHFTDGGAGLPADFDLSRRGGMGLRIIASMVESAGGSIAAYSENGAHFVIRLPAD
jgi:two-component sensor histidine kinase